MKARRDWCHHHPRVRSRAGGGWQWECACGSHSPRFLPVPWRSALIEALAHSTQVAS